MRQTNKDKLLKIGCKCTNKLLKSFKPHIMKHYKVVINWMFVVGYR